MKTKGFSAIWILIISAILVLIVGFVLYSQNQNKTVKPTSSSVSDNTSNLETDLNSLDDGTDESELNALEKDLQNL